MMDNIFRAGDFDLGKTIRSGQCFRYEELSSETTTRYRVFSADSCCIVSQPNSKWEREFICIDIVGGSKTLEDWRCYFGVSFVDEKERHMAREIVDNGPSWLQCVFDFSSGVSLLRQDPWETLITFIISQRNNIPRIKQCVKSLCEIYGVSAYQNWCPFPTPYEVSRMSLDRCNLGYRAPYVKGAATAVIQQHISFADLQYSNGCSSDRAVTELMRLHGVGVKVAKCVALFSLGHHQLFPVDIWISRAMQEFNITQEQVKQWGECAGLIQQRLYFYMLFRET